MNGFILDLMAQPLAVCRLDPMSTVPTWVAGDLVSVTRTPTELSIVCAADAVPLGTTVEGPFRAVAVRGPLDFAMTGALLALAAPLAEADVPILAISTFDTYLLLVPAHRVAAAAAALTDAGHEVIGTA